MTTIASPPGFGSAAQRQRAMTQAKGTFAARAELKRRVRAAGRDGALVLASVLTSPPAALHSIYVWQLVLWVQGVGDTKAALMLRGAGVDPWRRVRRLTASQTAALIAELGLHAERKPASLATPRARGNSRVCQCCGERLRNRSESGNCGFCEEGI